MSRPLLGPVRSRLRRLGVTLVAGGLAAAALALVTPGGTAQADEQARTAAARRTSVVTPGDFTGYGFDQCLAPSQQTMDAWLQSSPFLAVGIYISGNSRGCRNQPNLTPAWISTQLAHGWRLLPITLGPQASCSSSFPRYGASIDPTIIPDPGRYGGYGRARKQGSAEATKTVGVAQGLGIAPGSTLWYDLEGFDSTQTRCRESALAFLSAWTTQVHKLGYVSGVYSSAGSGILALDNARVNGRTDIALPDQLWIARWDGNAGTDVESKYLRADGWQPHARVKQYEGGHDETWGGVRINIDRDYLDLGRGSVAERETHCGGVRIGFGLYPVLQPRTSSYVPPRRKVKALKCLLTEQGLYSGAVTGQWDAATTQATNAWQSQHGFPVSPVWSRSNWMSLLAAGDSPVVKYGSAGPAVRRVQRALNAVEDRAQPLNPTGVFDAATTIAVKAWQKSIGVQVSGVIGTQSWKALAAGRR
jgi:peptidoglycan hydrolase-like protein with peptidoglycan-binding domain